MSDETSASRRLFLKHSAAAGAALITPAVPALVRAQAPAIIPGSRPLTPLGLQIGDVLADRAIVWSRSDRPARMLVEWSTTPEVRRRQDPARARPPRPGASATTPPGSI